MGTVIFDLDGTLADTSGDLIAAANACFKGLGLDDLLDPKADAATAFRGGRAMLKLGFERIGADVDVEVEFPKLVTHYSEHIDVHTTLYPGVMEAVDTLKTAGYRVGICTNKPEAQTTLLLARLGIREAFASVVAADTLPVRKPDPAPYIEAVTRAGGDPARSLLVGDTVTDRDTARAAGVPIVLVTFGPDGDDVATLGADALLPEYGALPGVAADLLGLPTTSH